MASKVVMLLLLAAGARASPETCAPSRDSALVQVRGSVKRGTPAAAEAAALRPAFERVGCFRRAEGDEDDAHVYMDKTCVRAPRDDPARPCRSGLPFFRKAMEEGQSVLDCAAFCLSKGLDLSGVVSNAAGGVSLECRCGASANNAPAWHERAPPEGLLLPSRSSGVKEQDPACAILASRYSGPTDRGAVPYRFLQLSVDDNAYLDEVAEGVDHVVEEDDPDDVEEPAAANETALSLVQQRPFPSCDTGCSPGGGAWTRDAEISRQKAQSGLVSVNYYYVSGLDQDRREAFQLAMEEWEAKTCIRFVESSQTPRMEVGVTNEGSCSAGLGYPGRRGTSRINLGWCNSRRHVGSVVHEIGHSLGMNHEQKRSDAQASIDTTEGAKGPFLRMFWNNIDQSWQSQYLPDSRSYIGSETAGYADYDYGSIMHYGRGSPGRGRGTFAFETVNPVFNSVVGSRSALSENDVKQILDMYQCSAPGGSPTPAPSSDPTTSPTPAPTRAPTGAPAPGPTQSPGSCPRTCSNQNCDFWVQQGYPCQQLTDRYRCNCAGCSSCPSSPTPAPVPTPAPTRAPTPAPTSAPTQAPGSCPSTCSNQNCNFWVQQGYSCQQLMGQFGCNCGGCSSCTASSCPNTCSGQTCDYWVQRGWSCQQLTSRYRCNCGGCSRCQR